MWNEPTKSILEQIPKLNATEEIPAKDKIIYLHFFIGASDWYVAEFNGDDIFFIYAILGGDFFNSEWGYVSFSDLKNINIDNFEVDYDLYWEPCKAGEIENIKQGMGW
jgi:hypothetical protein